MPIVRLSTHEQYPRSCSSVRTSHGHASRIDIPRLEHAILHFIGVDSPRVQGLLILHNKQSLSVCVAINDLRYHETHADLDGLSASGGCGGVGHHLGLDAPVHGSEEAMQKSAVAVPEQTREETHYVAASTVFATVKIPWFCRITALLFPRALAILLPSSCYARVRTSIPMIRLSNLLRTRHLQSPHRQSGP